MSAGRQDWQRDESRYVDGEAGPEEARRLDDRRRADPDLDRRIEEWEETADLWRADAARIARALDTESLADRVLDRVASVRPGDAPASFTARAYATAALVLIGIGLAGSLALGARGANAGAEEARTTIRSIERARLDIQADLEMERLLPGGR